MLNDLFIKPDYDNAKIDVTFSVPKRCHLVEYQILDEGKAVVSGSAKPENGKVSFEEQIADFKPWSVDTPFLYELKLELDIDGTSEAINQSFGMYKYHVEGRKMYFNNKPFFMRGYIRGREAHEHPNLMGCSEVEYYEKNIKMAKAYGFNFIRFHSVVPPEEFFDAANRLGMVCQVEIRKYFPAYQKQKKEFDDDQTLVNIDDWTKEITRLRNHPSLMVYCLGNQINAPGRNPQVKEVRELTAQLDPTRLFLDTCSRGEYDRDTADIDVQHMSYFAPFGKNYNMFDDSIHLSIYGSITGKEMEVADREENPTWRIRREVPVKYPLSSHELAHYNVLRDPYLLDEKFKKYGSEKPWWIDELKKMIKEKGHEGQYQKMLEASTHYFYIWTKQAFESVRKSPEMEGFHYLQLADTERYENANGLIDCFDDPKEVAPEQVLPFNADTVLIADLPRRSLTEREQITIPVFLSNYSSAEFGNGTFRWSLKSRVGGTVDISGEMRDFDLSWRGLRKICRIELTLPKVEKAESLVFSCELVDDLTNQAIVNQWDLWLFPNDQERLKPLNANVELNDIQLNKRYLQIEHDEDAELLITDRFDEKVFSQLEQGKDVLMMYRIAENRDRKAPKEKYYLPSTWDRFKGIIWDRGHNCGGFMRQHPVMEEFPNNGFVDWQFYDLIQDSDKINLDDFPVKVEPIIEGIDKAVRDRYDVGRFDLSEFVYDYTMRKFAYLFELKVGKGRLLITGLNFKGIEKDEPATCWMFESLVNYATSGDFNPSQSLSVDELKTYLSQKGSSKRIKERMMTQYWQIDKDPLEPKSYWIEAEAWLREDV